MGRKDAQKSQILQHLKRHGTITSMEAITLFGCTRLSGRIFDLRHEGYLIRSDKTEGKARNGNACQFTTYVYEGRLTEDGHLEPATWCDNRRLALGVCKAGGTGDCVDDRNTPDSQAARA